MLRAISTYLLLFSFGNAFTQSKLDNIWLYGVLGVGGHISFNTQPPDTSLLDTMEMSLFATESIICDSLGELLFYSNGR